MSPHLIALLAHYGLFVLFAAIGLESMGIPLPGETVLLATTAYAAHVGAWSPETIFAVAAAAAVVGDNAGYGLGRWGGWPVVRRWGRYARLDDRRLKVARYVFARHGGWVVLVGRFVALLRTTSAFLAGVNLMPWRRFLAFNAVGGLAWAAVWTVVGYVVGAHVSLAGGPLHWVLPAAALAGIAGGALLLRRHWDALAGRAEATYPGPL